MFIGLGGHEPVLQQGIWMVTTDGKNFDLGDVFLRGGGLTGTRALNQISIIMYS